MRSIDIDWSNHLVYENVDMTCPFCHGEEKIDFETWKDLVLNRHNPKWDRYTEVREQLSIDYKEYLADCIENEEEEFEFHDWLEAIMWGNIDGNSIYEDSCKCHECESGYINPVMNYAYPVDCEFTDKNRRIALEHGLFLFEHPADGDVYMSLTGGGMDLSPNILLAYLRLTGRIPMEWATEFRQDYKAYLSEEEHMEIAKACRETIKNAMERFEYKIKSLNLFIDNHDEMKKKLKERDVKFDNALKELSDIDDPLIRGLGALSAYCNYSKDVVN